MFISQLLHDHGEQAKYDTAQTSKHEYVKKAMKFIKTNFKDDISVDSVAQNIGLHRSYLYSLFQEYAGISVCDSGSDLPECLRQHVIFCGMIIFL